MTLSSNFGLINAESSIKYEEGIGKESNEISSSTPTIYPLIALAAQTTGEAK